VAGVRDYSRPSDLKAVSSYFLCMPRKIRILLYSSRRRMSNAAASVDAETSPGCGPTTALLYRSAYEHPSLLSLYRKLVQQVKVQLEAAEEMAKNLLSNYRTQLEALASRAAERKVLDGDEVRSVISAGSTAVSENPKNQAP